MTGDLTIYQSAAREYRDRLGWTVHTLGTVVWPTPATPIEAFNIPDQLGTLALDRLTAAGTSAPAIAAPGPPDRVVLLVAAHDGPPGDLLNLLARHDPDRLVGYAYLGHHHGRAADWTIDLPPTQHPGHQPLTWITPPDTPLPAARHNAQALADLLTNPAA
jgi:hypothetical protein